MRVQFDFDFTKEKIEFDGDFVKTTTQNINGQVYERAYLGSGVAVLPIMRKERKVMLIQEFRVHYGDGGETQWKLITGWMEHGHESFLDAAKQEFLEEAGGKSEDWGELHDAHHKATVSARKKYFACYDPEFVIGIHNPDGDIVLDKKWVSEDCLWQMIDNKEISLTRDVLVALVSLRNL